MKRALLLILTITACMAQPDVETRVLLGVQKMMKETGGRVTFSDLYNDSRFDKEEKAFLGRLYEVFFKIPPYLKNYHEENGAVPSRSQIGSHFGISPTSVELLLRVMQSDSRVPPMFVRNPETGEIAALKLEAIDAFVRSRGDQVKLTQWEGKPLPEFELERFDGGRLSGADLEGSPSLIYFWFTGCPPCVRIAPILAKLEKEYRDKGLQVVGFNADRILEIEVSEDQRRAYLQKSGTEYLNVHLSEEARTRFGNVNVYPTLFFADSNGVIVRHMLNFQERETLESVIRELVK